MRARSPSDERGGLDIHPVVLRRLVEYAADSVRDTLRNERKLATPM
jgi:hypothetical protein